MTVGETYRPVLYPALLNIIEVYASTDPFHSFLQYV